MAKRYIQSATVRCQADTILDNQIKQDKNNPDDFIVDKSKLGCWNAIKLNDDTLKLKIERNPETNERVKIFYLECPKCKCHVGVTENAIHPKLAHMLEVRENRKIEEMGEETYFATDLFGKKQAQKMIDLKMEDKNYNENKIPQKKEPWSTVVKCNYDNDVSDSDYKKFLQLKKKGMSDRSIYEFSVAPCENDHVVNEENIFAGIYTNDQGKKMVTYRSMCECGLVLRVSQKLIPNDVKERLIEKAREVEKAKEKLREKIKELTKN